MSSVKITLDGKEEELKCTLAAAKRVNALGGFTNVLMRLGAFDTDAFNEIIAAGLNKKVSEVEEAVFNTGYVSLSDDVHKFVGMLTRGGKEAPVSEEEMKTGEA